jgi:hypothetical protein
MSLHAPDQFFFALRKCFFLNAAENVNFQARFLVPAVLMHCGIESCPENRTLGLSDGSLQLLPGLKSHRRMLELSLTQDQAPPMKA